MALVDEIKAQTKAAMKAKDDVAKNILRLALGEIQLAESRSATPSRSPIGKRSSASSSPPTRPPWAPPRTRRRRPPCRTENRILEALLPAQLSVDGIVELLEPVAEQIRGAKADGPAMGVAMKHLKTKGAPVAGDDVRAAVTKIRA